MAMMEIASSSSSGTVNFEEFLESLYPKSQVETQPSLLEVVSTGLSNCVDYWFRNLSGVLGHLVLDRKLQNTSQKSIDKSFDPKLASDLELPVSSTFSLRSHGKCIPHPEKVHTGGEDAHFFTANSCGVFDGVGGWSQIGINDAAAFASGLMSEAQALALSSEASAISYDPQYALEAAFQKTTSSNIRGSSTALVVTINPKNGYLTASLVGDSIFVVIRKKKIVYRAPTQQHYFNCPFQLGIDSDKPSDAWQLGFQVEEGDIIVSASDGFWDNFFEEDFLSSLWVFDWISSERRTEVLSRLLAERAFGSSLRRDCVTPFSLASRMAGVDHRGGKVDDITVVVSEVVRSSTE